MRAHALQHVPFEGLGGIRPLLRERGWTITSTSLWEGAAPPEPSAFDLLIVMGGPMGVYDVREHPWLVEEKRCIERAIRAGRPVLGICLGAQLIADVLGARVHRNPHREIGWFPVERTADALRSRLGRTFPETFEAFHWHGDTFDLPAGATHLARSAACERQAFSYEEYVLGLQFHIETTREGAQALLAECKNDLVPGPYVQSADEIVGRPERYEHIAPILQAAIAPLLGAP